MEQNRLQNQDFQILKAKPVMLEPGNENAPSTSKESIYRSAQSNVFVKTGRQSRAKSGQRRVNNFEQVSKSLKVPSTATNQGAFGQMTFSQNPLDEVI